MSEISIGAYSSWMLTSDAKGCAVLVPADDILDKMLDGMTLQEANEEAHRLALAGVRYEGLK